MAIEQVPLVDFRVHETVRVRFNEIDGQNIVSVSYTHLTLPTTERV